jgi:hypothetical protein
MIFEVILRYTKDVKSGKFPEEQHFFHADPLELKKLYEILKRKKIGVNRKKSGVRRN